MFVLIRLTRIYLKIIFEEENRLVLSEKFEERGSVTVVTLTIDEDFTAKNNQFNRQKLYFKTGSESFSPMKEISNQ